MGPIAAEIAAMARNDIRLPGGHSRGLDHHGAIIQDGMDCDERDMEPPKKSMGSHTEHIS
jgi:hypothetical protein